MKKEIYFITDCLRGGGAERVVSILANYFSGMEQYSVNIVTFHDYEIVYKIQPSVKVIPLKKNGILKLFELRKLLANADCIISFDYSICIRTYFATFMQKRVHIMSERNDPSRNTRRKIAKIARLIAYSHANAIVFQTENAKNYFPLSIQKKGTIIMNPVDYDNLPCQTEAGRKSKRIIAVGRLEPQKNFSQLIDAFNIFQSQFPGYTLEIFGDGSEKEMLNERITQYRLNDKIMLRGYSNDIYNEMANSALYISTSLFEGISNAMLEAICIGIPVIATDCNNGGARDCIIDGKNGYVVPVNNDNALLKSMYNFVTNEGLRNKCMDFDFEIRSNFSIEAIGKMWDMLIQAYSR